MQLFKVVFYNRYFCSISCNVSPSISYLFESSLFFLCLAKHLSILLIFSKNQLLVSFFPILFISFPALVISFLLTFGLVFSSFSSSLRCKVSCIYEVLLHLSQTFFSLGFGSLYPSLSLASSLPLTHSSSLFFSAFFFLPLFPLFSPAHLTVCSFSYPFAGMPWPITPALLLFSNSLPGVGRVSFSSCLWTPSRHWWFTESHLQSHIFLLNSTLIYPHACLASILGSIIKISDLTCPLFNSWSLCKILPHSQSSPVS